MQRLSVLFLWHMHQPDYSHGLDGDYRLPWVRLHACKGYYEMIAALRPFERIGATFNFSPCLIAQLEDYAQRGLETPETCLQLSLKSPGDLTHDEVDRLLSDFFNANWDTMVRPEPGYARLLEKRGLRSSPQYLAQARRSFSKQDLLDLQVWFNLAWCGPAACRDLPQLAQLKRKGMQFSAQDKREVLVAQIELVRRVLAEYREAAQQGRIEISASPFYHPILPLLIDSRFAHRASPERDLPFRFRAPRDARDQIERGLDRMQRWLGTRPSGVWPSEGSICPELIGMLAEAGVEWIASDEGVLARSLDRHAEREDWLYRPYTVRRNGSQVRALFRDHQLSDLIGFTYSKNDPRESAEDFVGRLQSIGERTAGRGDEPCVAVVLDGENAWEYFPGGGERFLEALYSKLESQPNLRVERIGEYLSRVREPATIERLHSGSWINADYNVWIGHPEENQAWNLLGQTRQMLVSRQRRGPALEQSKIDRAWELIYQAEGSDWFWWFGDDFTNPQKDVFDGLFRSKLAAVFRELDEPLPDELQRPLSRDEHQADPLEPPLDFITPRIDGRVTHFYEWENAGVLKFGQSRGQMHLGRSLLANAFYGFDLQNFYLRLDPCAELLSEPEVMASLLIEGPATFEARFALRFDGSLSSYTLSRSEGGEQQIESIAGHDVIELALPFAAINAEVDQRYRLQLRLYKSGIELDRLPRYDSLELQIPDKSFQNLMWSC
ncbi:MAG: glycoside hydrolase family 57 protein [Candidatus Alcyoniella australis]|nr:glycoside hydrolase family 57 protein [Candidatus Alcyoniella australis]